MTTAIAFRKPQAIWIGGYLTTSYLWILGWVLVIAIVVNLILQNVPALFTFEWAQDAEFTTNSLSFIMPPVGAVLITAFVIAIVNAGYTRILIGQGATRSAIAIGNLLAIAAGLAFVVVAAILWRLVENSVPGLVSIESQLDMEIGLREYVWLIGLVAVVLVFGALIATLFQRWHWIVGTALIVLAVIGLPYVMLGTPTILDAFDWVGTPWIVAAVLAALYAWLVRGVEVN